MGQPTAGKAGGKTVKTGKKVAASSKSSGKVTPGKKTKPKLSLSSKDIELMHRPDMAVIEKRMKAAGFGIKKGKVVKL